MLALTDWLYRQRVRAAQSWLLPFGQLRWSWSFPARRKLRGQQSCLCSRRAQLQVVLLLLLRKRRKACVVAGPWLRRGVFALPQLVWRAFLVGPMMAYRFPFDRSARVDVGIVEDRDADRKQKLSSAASGSTAPGGLARREGCYYQHRDVPQALPRKPAGCNPICAAPRGSVPGGPRA